jgi:hypothetical protein
MIVEFRSRAVIAIACKLQFNQRRDVEGSKTSFKVQTLMQTITVASKIPTFPVIEAKLTEEDQSREKRKIFAK